MAHPFVSWIRRVQVKTRHNVDLDGSAYLRWERLWRTGLPMVVKPLRLEM